MIKYKIIKITLAASVVLAGANMAFADFNIYADPAVLADKVNKDDRHSFNQIGGSLEKAKVIKGGFAPLKIAIDHLIPKDWEIKMKSGIGLEDSVVKWDVGTWPYALESISVKNDMNIVINWERRYVSIGSEIRESNIDLVKMEEFEENHKSENTNPKMNLLTTNTETVTSQSLLKEETGSTAKSLVEKDTDMSTLDLLTKHDQESPSIEQTMEEMSPKEKYELEKQYKAAHVLHLDTSFEAFVLNQDVKKHEYMQLTYILKAGKSLQDNLREWAKEMPNNWTVTWDAKKDFLIEKDVKIANTFIDVFPEVESFYLSSKYPMKIDMYLKNNIVHVYNKELKLNHREAGIQ